VTGEILERLLAKQSLSRSEAKEIFDEFVEGRCTQAQMAAFLVALRVKGETSEEISGAVLSMREHAVPVPFKKRPEFLLDVCGTGGDCSPTRKETSVESGSAASGKFGTFNVSTVAAFIIAGCGVHVAKHGNKAVSSKCGSADLLEKLGVNIFAEPETVALAIEEAGIGFIFAPRFHPAMKFVAPVRKELGVRTIFNLLGPLVNPARPEAQLIGVFSAELTMKIAQVLAETGVRRALVVNGSPIDEISVCDDTCGHILENGVVSEWKTSVEELGLRRWSREAIKGADRDFNASIAVTILKGEEGACADAALANAGAGLFISGKSSSIKEGIAAARESINSGKAKEALRRLIEITNNY
jgi:anthranilate phosphoribosyltransferase